MKPFSKQLPEVKIVLSPSDADYRSARLQYEEITGTNNTYTHSDIWERIISQFRTTLIIQNSSLAEAEAVAEPIRIMFPQQHVNIYGSDGSFIGNVTWADQMEKFWEYPVYTPLGIKLREQRIAQAESLGLLASFE